MPITQFIQTLVDTLKKDGVHLIRAEKNKTHVFLAFTYEHEQKKQLHTSLRKDGQFKSIDHLLGIVRKHYKI